MNCCKTLTPKPLVVFCRFRDDIESVIAECKSHGRSHSELSGKINDLHKWQAGETNVLVAQIQSGGIGIDLTRASLGIFYSVGHSLSEYLQAVARLHRPGQTQSTRLYSLSARLPNDSPTVEVRAYQSLFEKGLDRWNFGRNQKRNRKYRCRRD